MLFVRKYIYPIYNIFVHLMVSPFLKLVSSLRPTLWLLSQRGNDYARHRARVNKYFPIKDSVVLIAGCGEGDELESWIEYAPSKLIGVDLAAYPEKWKTLTEYYWNTYHIEVEFHQADLTTLPFIATGSLDIISSDAVFEHIRFPSQVLKEFNRVLAAQGVLYSTFGPLWFSSGGDHISGNDNISNAYNHLTLSPTDYSNYLAGFGPYTPSAHDGRYWINSNLFSKLKVNQYYDVLMEQGFNVKFSLIILNLKGLWALLCDSRVRKLRNEVGLLNMLMAAMSFIATKGPK